MGWQCEWIMTAFWGETMNPIQILILYADPATLYLTIAEFLFDGLHSTTLNPPLYSSKDNRFGYTILRGFSKLHHMF